MRSSVLFLVISAVACSEIPSSTGADAGLDGAIDEDASLSDSADAGEDEEPDYARLFPEGEVVDIDLALDESDWEILLESPMDDVYVSSAIIFDGIEVQDVGVRFKGNSSRNQASHDSDNRFSFKVDIDHYVEGQELLGIDKLNLNNGFKDPTFLREHLANAMFRNLGVPAPRTAFARLTINGELWGLYVLVEQVEQKFLKAWFDDSSGNLYKPEHDSGSLIWKGDSIDDYPDIGLKTNEDDPDHTGLINFLSVLNFSDSAEEIEAVLDVDRLLKWLAVNTALSSMDSYAGSAHNYYLYEDPESGRFVLIPWDSNEAFGGFGCGRGEGAVDLLELSYLEPYCGDSEEKPLIARILEFPEYLSTYEEYMSDFVAGEFQIDDEVEIYSDLIRPYVEEDPTRFYSMENFEDGLYEDVFLSGPMSFMIYGLTSFVERRSSNLVDELP